MPYVIAHAPGRPTAFNPRGAALDLWKCKDHEVMIEGPADTGKTYSSCQKLDALLWKYPGAQAVMIRRTYHSLIGTVLRTYEKVINHPGAGAPIDGHPIRFYGGNKPEWADYPNGSRLYFAGMDNPSKALSAERDFIYVNQAEELQLSDWEVLTTRASGRAGNAPYSQILGDCNPGAPSHWILHRPSLKRFPSRHEDNPTIFDADGNLTPSGRIRMAVLDALTGVRKQRLRYGRWVQAEGVVYESFDRALHLIKSFPIPQHWRRVMSIDFGYTNPSVYQWWAIDGDGRMFLYRELYAHKKTARDFAKRIKELENWYLPGTRDPNPNRERIEARIADHNAGERALLHQEGIVTQPAYKEIKPGIQAVEERLRKAGDGEPRLMIMDSALVERDEELFAARLPICTLDEFESYVYPSDQGGRIIKEVPVDANNHGCFVAGTMIATDRGLQPIEAVARGDRVMTRRGFRSVQEAGMTDAAARVLRVEFSNGLSFICTHNHPVWVEGLGFVRADALRYDDVVLSLGGSTWDASAQTETESKKQYLMDSYIGATRIRRGSATGNISGASGPGGTLGGDISIATPGFTIAAPFLPATKSTTKTKTLQITISTILNAFRFRPTKIDTGNSSASAARKPSGSIRRRFWHRPPNGIDPRKAEPGTPSTRENPTAIAIPSNETAIIAATNTRHSTGKLRIDSVPTNANQRLAASRELTILTAIARIAVRFFRSTNTRKSGFAGVHVRRVSEVEGRFPVFNLKVDGDPEYFANGILVHNCDAMRYAVAFIDKIRHGGPLKAA